MPTVKLVPSTYYLSSSSYLSVANAANMYADTDSDTYATVTNSRTSTTSYYIYLRGFDFSQIPEDAIVSSFTIRLKAYESGVSTSSSYKPHLANGTTAINGSCDVITTSAAVHTFTGISADWATIRGYGSNFGIRINCRRASRNTTSYMYIYGAEIEVTYSLPVYHDITVSNSTSATVSVSDSQPLEGSDVTVSINTLTGLTVTDNGVDVTNQFTASYPETSASRVLGDFTLVSGSFNSGQSWFQGIVGNGADTTETTTSNYYSGSSSTTAVFTYDMGMEIPSNAEVTRLWCEVSGHAESTSQASEYMCAQLISGSTNLSDELNFKNIGTSNSIQTIEATTLPTVAQLAVMKLQCRLGYYGGAINGATVHVEYEVPGQTIDHYEYVIQNVTADHAIVVIAGEITTALYVKQNGSWRTVSRAFRKVSGSWVEIPIDQAFQSGVNYRAQ